ncbi:hypothetical protein GINT2_001774 [Glugoides intestinalis]
MEKCIFDDYDIEKALEMVPEEPVDYVLKYFILCQFKRDYKKAIATVLDAQEKNPYCNLLLACMDKERKGFNVRNDVKNHFLNEITSEVAIQFFNNKYSFWELMNIKNVVPSIEIKDVITNVWTSDPWVITKFLFYIESRAIDLRDVVKEIMFLAKKGNEKATYLLGNIYLFGIGAEKDLEKALQYHWLAKSKKVIEANIGIARVYMEDENLNTENAIEYLEEALKAGSSPEAAYCMYLLTEKNVVDDLDDMKNLKVAAFGGYLPAVQKFSENIGIKKGMFEIANTSLISVISYHPEFLRYDRMAYDAYLGNNLRKALLIYLFLAEFNLSNPIKNAILILERHENLIDNQHNIKYEIYKFLAKKEPRYNKDVGDCYFNGEGVQQSYLSAFSSYLSSRKASEEGAYNAAIMYEQGLGIPKNLYEAKRIITKYLYKDEMYLVRLYALLRINVKILLFNHIVASSVITFLVCFATTLLLIKTKYN